MPVLVACPKCRGKIEVELSDTDQKLRCPLCSTVFVVKKKPTQLHAGAVSGSAAITSKAPPPPTTKVKPLDDLPAPDTNDRPPRKRRHEEDEDDDLPRKKKRRDEDDEEDDDDRPRKKRRDEDDEDDDDPPRKKRRDDDDDDDEDRPIRFKKKKRKKHQKSNQVFILSLAGGGGLLLAIIVGLIIFMFWGNEREKIMREQISIMNDMAALLEGVKDSDSAKAAAPRVEKIASRFQELKKRADAAGKATEAEGERLAKEFGLELKTSTERLIKAGFKAAAACQGEETFVNAFKKMEALNSESPNLRPLKTEVPAAPQQPQNPPPKKGKIARVRDKIEYSRYLDQLGKAYHIILTETNRPPKTKEDLRKALGGGSAPIMDTLDQGYIVFIYGVGPLQMSDGTSNTILAYEPDSDIRGMRLVLMGDGSVQDKTEAEFLKCTKAK